MFGEVTVSGTADVLDNWDAIKRQTKGQKTSSQAMDSVPREFPALMRAQKIQGKAAKSGFEFENLRDALRKLSEEYAEVEERVECGDLDGAAEELGDLIFSAVNVSRFLKADAEEVLTAATDKFVARYKKVEALVHEFGRPMDSFSPQELDQLWNQAKQS